MSPYRFSTVLTGHSKDVRCVAAHAQDSNALISGSRDCSVKMWRRGGELGPGWEEEKTFVGHHKYVSTVATLEPNEEFPEVRERTQPDATFPPLYLTHVIALFLFSGSHLHRLP